MTPSEKEKIIKEGFDAIRRVYNLRDDLLSDAGKLEAARESNRKLSDRVANLEVTIKTLNSAIDKKDAEIERLNNRLNRRDDAMSATIEALEKNRDNIYDKYLDLAHKSDADEEIKKHMIIDNRKKKDEIKSLREELEAEKYKNELANLEDSFHELRQKFNELYLWYARGMLESYHMIAFADWFKDTFGDFGVYDEEE